MPIVGFVLARRGAFKGIEPKPVSTLALFVNSGLLLLAVIGLIWAFWFHFMMAKVEGVFLINGETAEDPLIYLEDGLTWKKIETTRKDGSFTFYGLKPGMYSLHASSYIPPPVTCVSVSSDSEFEITNPSSDYYLINVLVDVKDL